jgi:hypothetical protein
MEEIPLTASANPKLFGLKIVDATERFLRVRAVQN